MSECHDHFIHYISSRFLSNITFLDICLYFQNPNISPPVITRPLYNISAYVGQATVLSCEAESDTENMGVSIGKFTLVFAFS